MALRWCAAGMVEAGKQFRRVNGHLHLPTLRTALERETAEPVGTKSHDDPVSADHRRGFLKPIETFLPRP
jgi:putative transposase